jgi:hypothetical protein
MSPRSNRSGTSSRNSAFHWNTGRKCWQQP